MMTRDKRGDGAGDRIAILHIGAPKTGSTAIQHALRGYDDGTTFYATFKDTSHSHMVQTAFHSDYWNENLWKRMGFRAEDFRRKKAEYLAEFSAMLNRRDRNRIVVSAENTFGLENADKTKLVEFIRRHGWKVRVVAYVREPAGWAAAWLSEQLRNGNWERIPCKIDPQYRHGLETFAGLLPPECLHVRPFDRDRLAEGDVIADFCQILGLDLSRIAASRTRMNESLPLPAAKLLFRFNRSGLLSKYDLELHGPRKQLVEAVSRKYAGTRKLTPALCEGVADYSETDWLYETFGIDFRRKTPPKSTAPAGREDLASVMEDISDVDLSGLDDLLAGYGVRCENFTTVEAKLHRLFYTALMMDWRVWAKPRDLIRALPRSLAQHLAAPMLKRLLDSLPVSPARRRALKHAAVALRDRWIARTGSRRL